MNQTVEQTIAWVVKSAWSAHRSHTSPYHSWNIGPVPIDFYSKAKYQYLQWNTAEDESLLERDSDTVLVFFVSNTSKLEQLGLTKRILLYILNTSGIYAMHDYHNDI